jgi:hypothetical protein
MESKNGHIIKISLGSIHERVDASPTVSYTVDEVETVIEDIAAAVDAQNYISETPTSKNPSLSAEYVFDTNDKNFILRDLKKENFVGKIKDLSKGAKKRLEHGLPQEYLYVFKYACKLPKRELNKEKIAYKEMLIYIKINDRKIPYKKIFIVSFHENRPNN